MRRRLVGRWPVCGGAWLRLTAAALLVALAGAAAARAAERELVAREGRGFVERIDGQVVVHLAGTPREMGLQHGRLLAPRIRETVQAFLYDAALGRHKLERGYLEGLWQKHLPHMPPAYLAEMRAVAEGAGVPFEDIRHTHVLPTRYHCSGAAVFGEATSDGKLYHYRSLDYSLDIGEEKTLQENACLLVREPEGGVAHVVVGWAGLVGCVTGMNAAGLSVGEMGSSSRDEDPGAGTPMMIHLLDLMARARSLDEGLELFRTWKRGEGYNFILADGTIPDARAIEVTRTKIAVFAPGDPEENRLPHTALPFAVRRTNHFVSPELASTQREPYNPLAGGARESFLGYQLITAYLTQRFGELDAEGMIGLCRAYPKEAPCLHQAVFCPVDGRLWVANARSPRAGRFPGAQNQTFYAYDLGELLATEPDDLAPASAPRAPEGEPPGAQEQAASPPAETGDAAAGAGAAEDGAVLTGEAVSALLDLTGVADPALCRDLAAFDPAPGVDRRFAWRMAPGRVGWDGALVYDLVFPSPRPSGDAVNDRVWCRFYPARDLAPGERAPFAIVLHHLGGDFTAEAILADFLARSGVHALEVEMPHYGPRKAADSRYRGLLRGDIPASIESFRQCIADVRRALDWALARDDVDPERVGVVGVSLGGVLAALAAGVEPRLKRNVLVIAGGDIAQILLHPSRELRRARAYCREHGIDYAELCGIVRPVEPTRYAFRADKGGILMLNSLQDEIVPRPATEALHEALGRPEIEWYPAGHYTIALFALQLFRRVRDHLLAPVRRKTPDWEAPVAK